MTCFCCLLKNSWLSSSRILSVKDTYSKRASLLQKANFCCSDGRGVVCGLLFVQSTTPGRTVGGDRPGSPLVHHNSGNSHGCMWLRHCTEPFFLCTQKEASYAGMYIVPYWVRDTQGIPNPPDHP